MFSIGTPSQDTLQSIFSASPISEYVRDRSSEGIESQGARSRTVRLPSCLFGSCGRHWLPRKCQNWKSGTVAGQNWLSNTIPLLLSLTNWCLGRESSRTATSAKGFRDFNDLATKSILGKEGLERQAKAIVSAAIEKQQAKDRDAVIEQAVRREPTQLRQDRGARR